MALEPGDACGGTERPRPIGVIFLLDDAVAARNAAADSGKERSILPLILQRRPPAGLLLL